MQMSILQQRRFRCLRYDCLLSLPKDIEMLLGEENNYNTIGIYTGAMPVAVTDPMKLCSIVTECF